MYSIVICDIVISEGDLHQCVKAHNAIYIILKLCVNVEEKLRLFAVWDACWTASHSLL